MSILNLICCRSCLCFNSQVKDVFHCSIIPLYSLMCTIFSDEIALCVNSSNLSFSVIYGILSLLLFHCTANKRLSSSSQTSLLFITIVSPLRQAYQCHPSLFEPTPVVILTHVSPPHTTSSFKSTKLLLFLTFIIPPCSLPANST